ncbi:co-chaperone protein Sba1p [Trichomonascus vanleenenianus]|uniref:Hsp90 cochaperone SBA1 n=1 Tax=Trichomonascus vanleenenianus TaxID=2268995 RepID=UPI003ECA41D9
MVHTLFPFVYWAQRSNATDEAKNVIFLTIILNDMKNEKVELESDHLKFESASEDDDKNYAIKINFFDEIDVDKSHQHSTGRGLFLVLQKKNKQAEYWPRLTKESDKHPYIKTDFDKWVDEDEQEEQPEEDPLYGAGAGAGGMGDQFDLAKLSQQLGGVSPDNMMNLSGLSDASIAGSSARPEDLEEEEEEEEEKKEN